MKIAVLLAVCALVAVKAEVDDDNVSLLRRLVDELEDEKREKKVEKDYESALLRLLGKRCYNEGAICNRDVECCHDVQRCISNKCTVMAGFGQNPGPCRKDREVCFRHNMCCSGYRCAGGVCMPSNTNNGNNGNNGNIVPNNKPNNYPGCIPYGRSCMYNQMCCTGNCKQGFCVQPWA